MPQDARPENEEPAAKGRLVRDLAQWVASETIGNALMLLLSWIFKASGNVLVWLLEALTL